MKKYIITLLAAAALIVTGCATVSETADGSGGKSGIVSAVKEDGGQKRQVKKTVYIPNVVKETSFFSDGYVEGYTTYTYDNGMNIVREDLFDSFDQILESAVYEEGENGSIKRLLYNSRGGLQSYRIVTFSDAGLTETESSFNAEGELQTSSVYEYDDDGNKFKWTVTDNSGVVLSETVYRYEDGLLSDIEIFNAGGTIQEYFTFKYSGDLMVEQEHADADGKLKSTVVYDYDGSALVAEKYMRPNGSTSRLIRYTNDDRGNPVKEEIFDGNGDLKDWLEREYEYSTEEIIVWE